jgi:predicted nucleic acid-binding protein
MPGKVLLDTNIVIALFSADKAVWIAAAAQQYGLPLATRDGHFKEIDGLALEIW